MRRLASRVERCRDCSRRRRRLRVRPRSHARSAWMRICRRSRCIISGKPDSGFDVRLAQASPSGWRPLEIQWFESKLDEDSSPQLEANALLSDGRCSLVGGYALTTDSLVKPGVKTASCRTLLAPPATTAAAASRSGCSRQASPTSIRR